MRVVIDPQVCKKYGLSIGEFLYIMVIGNHIDLQEAANSLKQRGLGSPDKFDGSLYPFGIRPTQAACDIFDQIVLESDSSTSDEEEYLSLAKKMIDIYPQGKKEGRYDWVEGPLLVARRLRIFEKKYGKYPEEDIITATQKYVDTKMGLPEMRVLKYFIFKERENAAGDLEGSSDLYTTLETMNQKKLFDDSDWMMELRE